MRIHQLEIENVKRIKAVSIAPKETLTIIGGDNAQGKTSVLDSIAWALGGDRYKPTNPIREGASEVRLRVELDNGIIVERSGTTGALKVSDPEGKKAGQTLLNSFVNAFALDLPKFMQATSKEKAKLILDRFPGIGEKLEELNKKHKALYDERHAFGILKERRKKHAEDLPMIPGLPKEPLNSSELSSELRDAMALNAENQRIKNDLEKSRNELSRAKDVGQALEDKIEELLKQVAKAREDMEAQSSIVEEKAAAVAKAEAITKNLHDVDTDTINQKLGEMDATNAAIRQNQERARAIEDAENMEEDYKAMTGKLGAIEADRKKLLQELDLPLEGLQITEEGDLEYNGSKWDCMSGAERLRTAAAICTALNPEFKFVLLDGLEQFDLKTLKAFEEWLSEHDIQAIGTRVSQGEECSIVIEDGCSSAASESDSYNF